MHRDLKPKNLLFQRDPDDGMALIVKLADYGFVKRDDLRRKDGQQTLLGSTPYMSPELLAGYNNYDHKTDVWSLGLIFYQMLFGYLPFKIDAHAQSLELVKKCIK
jgi:serine/threonine protein kinase